MTLPIKFEACFEAALSLESFAQVYCHPLKTGCCIHHNVNIVIVLHHTFHFISQIILGSVAASFTVTALS